MKFNDRALILHSKVLYIFFQEKNNNMNKRKSQAYFRPALSMEDSCLSANIVSANAVATPPGYKKRLSTNHHYKR